ncbi:unnamed protein product [Lactuca saligna]|uniref:Uncharacterized protein n=1 Tax=Lactuca saligna TaxID=75948 RepID=A0AA36DX97_LACSI|nr:unnamed protein product [Lactuca saligna]
MDMYFNVNSFRSLNSPYAWYNFACVRIDFVWVDIRESKLIMLVVDQNREKMVVVVPSSLIGRYLERGMQGRLYFINHFKLNSTPDDFPKYEGYNFVDDQYVIIVNQATRFTLLEPVIENHFPTYPLVESIEYLMRNPHQRNLIDVVGKVIDGHLLHHDCSIDLLLRDQSGYVIQLILNGGPEALPFKLARSIQEKWIIYVSRVKYRSRGGMNFLDSTSISRVAFEPVMAEANAIRVIYG